MKNLLIVLLLFFGSTAYSAGGYWRLKMNYTIDGVQQYGDFMVDFISKDSANYFKTNDTAFLAYLNTMWGSDDSLSLQLVLEYAPMPNVEFFIVPESHYKIPIKKIESAHLIGLEVASWGYSIESKIDLPKDTAWLKSDFIQLNPFKPLDAPGCVYTAFDHGVHPYGRALYELFLTLEIGEREKREYLLSLMRKHHIVVVSQCRC